MQELRELQKCVLMASPKKYADQSWIVWESQGSLTKYMGKGHGNAVSVVLCICETEREI